jgi:hypothetical protein
LIAGVFQPNTMRLAATSVDCMSEIMMISEINRANARAGVPVQYVFNCEAGE